MVGARRVTDKLVRLALVTHTRQEFLSGTASIQQRDIPVAMQMQAATLMASRCENWLKTLRGLLGEDMLRATIVVKPDRTFATAHRLEALPIYALVPAHGHACNAGCIDAVDRCLRTPHAARRCRTRHAGARPRHTRGGRGLAE